MVYKNGIREYALIALIFGALLGMLFGLYYASVVLGFLVGAVCGLLFALLFFLFVKFIEKKFDKVREEIAKERKIICDGGVTMAGMGGWMFLTDRGLEFYPHKFNYAKVELTIPMEWIISVKTNKNRIMVNTIDEQTYVVVVSHQKEWKKQIEGCISIIVP